MRKEATGYGLVYVTDLYLKKHEMSFAGKKVLISGAGNAEKVYQLGGIAFTMSDSNGCIIDEKGIDLDLVKEIKEIERGHIKEYVDHRPHATYSTNRNDVWKVKADCLALCYPE